jgi:hypothetical protein
MDPVARDGHSKTGTQAAVLLAPLRVLDKSKEKLYRWKRALSVFA